MNRLLERLDRHMTVLVPVLYLLGLAAGTAAYFTGAHIPAVLAVGVALAIAAELHSFLEQRRVRLTLTQLVKLAPDDARRPRLIVQMRLHLGLLIGLVLFSIGNGIAFWASISHPVTASEWIQIAIRGTVIPLLFLATGALAPISSDAAALLSQAADDMLYATVRTSVRQWKRRVKRARKANVDLSPLAISLMLDAGETDGARRIQLIAEGLAAAEAGAGVTQRGPNGRPPTGGGTPLPFAGREHAGLHIIPPVGAGWPDALNLPDVRNLPEPAPVATPMPTPVPAPAPVSQPMSPEEIRVRAALTGQPDLSVDEIVSIVGVARSTASKIRRIVLAERAVLTSQSSQQQLAQ